MVGDQTVHAKHVLKAVMDLERRGSDAVIKELEALEPDLVEYLLESSCQLHRRLMKLGLHSREALRLYRKTEAIALVCVTALRHAHFDLWRDTHGHSTTPDDPAGPAPDAPPR